MLAHFHFLNKGVVPFSLPHDEIGRAELSRAADLDDEQVDFVWRTSDLIKNTWRCKPVYTILSLDDPSVEY